MKKVLFILISAISVNCFASGRLHNNGDTINLIKITSDGGAQVLFQGVPSHIECGSANRSFYIESSHPGKEMMLSLVLAAKMSNKKITAYVSGCHEHGPKALTLDIL